MTEQAPKRRSAVEEFLNAHLSHQGTECVIWPFSTDQDGYANYNRGRSAKAHRIVCEIVHGPPPTSKHNASHSCHVRNCINPMHLSWKTFSQNMLDKREAGTCHTNTWGRKGKLSPDAVRKIRELAGVQSRSATARQFNITASNVRHIQQRRTWQHIA